MAYRKLYDIINIYKISAVCNTPLHIGSGEENSGEILIHPITSEPFIQASGIAGAFRSYSTQMDEKQTKIWFGDSNNETKYRDDFRSRLIFTDAFFRKGSFNLELRTRVRINPDTGTTAVDENGKSGQLLQTEYISKGSKFNFIVYEYCEKNAKEGILEKLLKALDSGDILLGGQLSNGCGAVKLESVRKISCNMTTEKGRKCWREENAASSEERVSEIRKLPLSLKNIRDFYMDICFDQTVLVKGDYVDQKILEHEIGVRFREGDNKENGDRLPDKMPLMDGNKKFIIPGSSYKGVFRNHINSILNYLKKESQIAFIDQVFEKRSCLFFYDSEVTDGIMNIQVRTHLDKFTGSVIDKALFQEAVYGGKESKAQLHIRLIKKGTILDDQITALLLMTMRDFAIGAITVGSGYSIGRGYMKVNNISVKESGTELMSWKPTGNNNKPISNKFITSCMQALKQEVEV